MGRTSKFSFPSIPGRSKKTEKLKAPKEEKLPPPPKISKAQRILGVEQSLSIDSPSRTENESWRSPRPASSGMTIAISESSEDEDTQSRDGWDVESAIIPPMMFHGKMSSPGNSESDLTTAANRRIQREGSSNTLKSFYDRQKSPLAISQQTAASSMRDSGLRKGYVPTKPIPRSPLLDSRSPMMDADFVLSLEGPEVTAQVAQRIVLQPKKKPTRLNLSRLFSNGSLSSQFTQQDSPSPAISKASVKQMPRKLSKTQPSANRSKGRPQGVEAQSQTGYQPQQDNFHGYQPQVANYDEVYDGHKGEPSPRTRVVRMSHHDYAQNTHDEAEYRGQGTKTVGRDPGSRPSYDEYVQHMQSMIAPPWDKQSTTSSKRTSTSVFSEINLRNTSILSLSDEESSDPDERVPVVSNAAAPWSKFAGQHERASKSKSPPKTTRRGDQRREEPLHKSSLRNSHKPAQKSRSSKTQDENYLTIPLPNPGAPRIAGPWALTSPEFERLSRNSSNSSFGPTSQLSPPPSPRSFKSRTTSIGSARVMTVTKQEEALLEALRQKRARMKEKIIKEHQKENVNARATPLTTDIRTKTASQPQNRIMSHKQNLGDSSAYLLNGAVIDSEEESSKPKRRGKDGEQILLYLDRPIQETNEIDTAEPSPDLSGFLSFDSDDDDDSTPRTSYVKAKTHPVQHFIAGDARPDSMASPAMGGSELGAVRGNRDGNRDLTWGSYMDAPPTPRSAARLSAVGSSVGSFPMHDYRGVEKSSKPLNQTFGWD